MKKAIILAIVLLLLAGNAYAAGDLIVENGLLGIGATNPLYKLDIRQGHASIDSDGPTSLYLKSHNDLSSQSSIIYQRRSRGTLDSQTAVSTSDTLGRIEMWGYDGSTYARAGQIRLTVAGLVDNVNHIITGKWLFNTTTSEGVNKTSITVSNGDGETPVLTVNGIATAQSWNVSSDIRIKKDVELINSPLRMLMNIDGVSYTWNREEYPDKGFPRGKHYGVIADEMELIMPDAVHFDENGEKSVAYMELIPVLIEAVKEQQNQISELQAEIEKLKNRR